MSINYRPDIDGLRALAVMPVVLFHAKIPGFAGGFVGVDIFFVISGFLITSILLRELQEGSFSIKQFYHRRIKRIFPVLFVVLIVCSLISMWLMFNGDYRKFQGSLSATLLFYSNYYFMFDVGYFDGAAETKPLLHMWSLAVEEQYYLLFPLYLLLIYKYIKKTLLLITAIITVLSLAYAIFLTEVAPSDAFYSTPARAWELMVGSMLAMLNGSFIIKSKKTAEVVSWVGLLAVSISIIGYSKATKFPGFAALLPTLGTVFIIWGGNYGKTFVSKFLSLKPLVWMGLISFSLYLWHWPLLVFYHKYSLGLGTYLEMGMLLLVMLILSYFSWKFVECPFRKGNIFSRKYKLNFDKRAAFLFILIFVTALISVIEYKKTYPPEVSRILMAHGKDNGPLKWNDCEQLDNSTKMSFSACKLGAFEKQDISFAVFGDSHADMLLAGINESAKEQQKAGVYVGSGGCLPFIGAHQIRQGFENCAKRNDEFLTYLEKHEEIENVLMIARWAIYAEGSRYKNTLGADVYIKDDMTKETSKLENKKVFERSFKRTISALSKLNKKVIIIGQIPESEWGASGIAFAKMHRPTLQLTIKRLDYIKRQEFVNSIFEKYSSDWDYTLVSPIDYMCDELQCKLTEVGRSIYRDNAHITRSFSKSLSHLFDGLL